MSRSAHLARRSGWRALAPTALGALVAVALAAALAGPDPTGTTTAGTGTGTGTTTGTREPTESDDVAPVSLTTFDSCSALLDHYRSTALAQVGAWGLGGPTDMMTAPLPTAVAVPRAAAPGAESQATDGARSESGTTVQVAGVDEADIVKQAGDLLLVLGQGSGGQTLQILRTSGDGTADLVGRLATDWRPSGMLVDRGTVVLMGSTGTVYPPGPADTMAGVMPIGVERTRIDQIDISRPDRPRRVRSMMLDGSASGARMVDGVVRIALTSRPRLRFDTLPGWGGPVPLAEDGTVTTGPRRPDPTPPTAADLTERNRATVRSTTIEDWLPRYDLTQADGTQTSGTLLACPDVAAPSEPAGVSTLTLIGIDLREGGLDSRTAAAVVASGSTVYATAERTYVATASSPFATRGPGGSSGATTRVHAFDTSGRGAARFLAGGAVQGTLLNQFSMDRHDGALRIATTDESQSRVTVLRESGRRLVATGTVDGLGKGERIYAVRFAGPIGYVVTFRQTDPLYTLDLTDPAHPRMVGELKIRGYSAYLHPAGDGLLLGVGQDADAGGRVTGLQMSLFDVSNLAAPHRISQVTLPGASSDAEGDHHAFMLDGGLALVPYRGSDRTGAGEGGLLAVRVAASGLDGPTLLRSSPRDVPLRTVVDDGIVWAIGLSGVTSYDQDTLQTKGFTAFR